MSRPVLVAVLFMIFVVAFAISNAFAHTPHNQPKVEVISR